MLFYAIILGAIFLGCIAMLGTMEGITFVLELLGLVALLVLTLVGFVTFPSWGEKLLFFVLVAFLGNLLLIRAFLDFLSLPLLLAVLAGFGLSLLQFLPQRNGVQRGVGKRKEEVHSMVFPDEPLKSTFSPGKYVGSKFGATYHEPKSEWAKKIKPVNQVWFQSKEEAEKKGYQAHGSLA